MNVLMMNQFFYPDVAPTGQLMTDLALDLTQKGCRVTIITGRFGYGDKKISFSKYELFQGVKIFRVISTHFGRKFLLGRLSDYITFFISALLKALFIKKSDVVICLSTPPWILGIGWVLKKVKKYKFVCWIQDLYPDVAAKLGLLNEKSRTYHFLKDITKHLFERADRLIVLSPSMKHKLLQQGLAPDRIEIISNWASGTRIFPVQKEKNNLLEKWEFKNKFVVLYSGNLGRCHHFDTLLPVIHDLVAVPDILFLFIGDGYGSQILKEFKNVNHLQNLCFFPYQKSEDLAQTLSVGDVHLVTLKEGMEDLMVPSKVYSALAAARPVIYIGPHGGEVPRIMEEAKCGVCVNIGDEHFLKESILRFYKDPDLVRSLGEEARAYFELRAEQKHSTSKFYDILKK